jgi:hypothetical protein
MFAHSLRRPRNKAKHMVVRAWVAPKQWPMWRCLVFVEPCKQREEMSASKFRNVYNLVLSRVGFCSYFASMLA